MKNTQFDEVFEVNSSVLDCLRYACKDHYNAAAGALASPKMLSEQHNISPRQYQRVALKIRASMQEWADIDNLLLSKVISIHLYLEPNILIPFFVLIIHVFVFVGSQSWRGTSKLQASLSIEEVLKTLHDNQAPVAVLTRFLKYVDNEEKRLHLAKTYQCSQVPA